MTSDSPTSPEVRPGSIGDALRNGRALLKDRPDLALSQAHAILRQEPRNPAALRLAAAAHRRRGEENDAEAAEMTAIRFSEGLPTLQSAAKALAQGNFGEASKLAADHLKSSPDDLSAWTLSAESALGLDLPEKAEPLLRKVLGRAPRFAPAERLLVSALIRQDKLQESRSRLEQLQQSGGAGVADLRLLAWVQGSCRDLDAAAATCELMLQQDDRAIDTWITYADTLRFLGRKMESTLAYRRALAIDPNSGLAWWSLVTLDPAAIGAEDIATMTQAIEKCSDQPEQLTNLELALGTVLDARGDHREAFRHFAAGNALRKAAQPYDPDDLTRRVEGAINHLTPGSVPARSTPPREPPTPVFIVGMPRSGSTLVERIFGCHSAIEAMGELPIVPHLVQHLRANSPQIDIAERIASLSAAELDELADRYRRRSSEIRRSDAPYFTDKLPMNWQYLPLILRMLPQARIIDVRRSALDCCWSNFKMLFARGHPAASDLTAIGRFYRDYVLLMDRIDAIAPERVLKVRYEELLSDLDGQTRRMLDYVGVTFEPACLEFHRSTAPVATASSEQVRRPLNREGIGTWKPYKQWLGPLIEELGPLADA